MKLTVPPDWLKTPYPPPSSPINIPELLTIPDPLTLTVPYLLDAPAITKLRIFAALVWVRLPVMFSTLAVVEVTAIPPVVLRFPARVSVPVLMLVVPFQEFALPERVSVPFPDLVRPLAPPRTLPETSRLAVPTMPPLFTVQVGEAPRVMFEEIVWVVAVVLAELVAVMAELEPSVILPPERVMFEDEPTMVIVFALTLPETVIVPVPNWLEAVPKFTAVEVEVVVVPESASVPVKEVLQPWVASFVVGSAHVPLAVPNPAVEPLLSQ